jgi:hypothetical protein
MATIDWKPIDNGGMGQIMQSALDASKSNSIDIDITKGFGQNKFVTPEEYYSDAYADKAMQAQQGMWDKYNALKEQSMQDKENFFNQRQAWLDEKEGLINSTYGQNTMTNSSSSAPTNDADKNHYREVMFNEFKKHGLSDNQALGLLMNVEAENGLQAQYLFGTHQDSTKTAYGALSWQGGREKELINRLNKAGLYKDGSITRTDDSLRIMSSYMIDELKSGKQGNYLSFKGGDSFSYAREANRTYTRSSRDAKILQGREKNYRNTFNWFNSRTNK